MISFVRGQKNDLYGGMTMKLPAECMHSRIFSYLATDSSDEYARSVVERRARTCVKNNSKHKAKVTHRLFHNKLRFNNLMTKNSPPSNMLTHTIPLSFRKIKHVV